MANQTDETTNLEAVEMDHIEIIGKSVAILRDRNEQYGDVGDVFYRACGIFEMITGEPISRYHATVFMHSLKLARIKNAPGKMDNYVDAINYMAFAGQFSGENAANKTVDDGIREMAEKLAPQYTE
jgi:hypothetical protein